MFCYVRKKKLCEILKKCRKEPLPYHSMGEHKYDALGMAHENYSMPDMKEIKKIKKIFEE